MSESHPYVKIKPKKSHLLQSTCESGKHSSGQNNIKKKKSRFNNRAQDTTRKTLKKQDINEQILTFANIPKLRLVA